MNDSSADDAFDIDRLGEHLPVGVALIDASATILHVNDRVLEMTGYRRGDLVGESALSLIHGDDADFVARALVAGIGSTTVMGPVRLRYRTSEGRPRWSEFWAQSASKLGIDGYIITMAIESVTDFLTGATYQIASDAPLETTLDAVAHAVGGFPLVARGTIVTRRSGASRIAGDWPLTIPPDAWHPAEDAPWAHTLLTGEPIDRDVGELPERLREAVADAGIGAIWTRPVLDQRGAVVAAFVAWRTAPGNPSPNQDRHLAEAVGLARLAFAHDDHRLDLERAALTDHLTGLGNRARLAQRLAVVEERRVAVLYVDLDGFKSVNDDHGHEVGDLVLRAVGKRLLTIVRDSDDVYRIGGDEFVVLCVGTDPHDREPLDLIAGRIVEALDDPFRIGEALIRIGASVGIAERDSGESTRDVIRRADHALLDAKRAGKRRWCHAPVGFEAPAQISP